MTMHDLLIVALIAASLQSAAQAQTPVASRPNVVLVMTDDMGWADLSSYGATDIKTPHIDSLGRDGIRLTNFYANGVLCTPTRAGLISGRYQQRFGLEEALAGPTSAAELGLAATGRTMPQLFRNNGYATALIGKWHLGYKPEFSPNAHGFDYFFGLKSGYHDFYQHTGSGGKPDLWENDRLIDVSGYTTDLITERALKFIEQNTNRPFFVDVAYNAPHWPYQPPDKPSVAARNGAHVRPGDMPISTASILAATGATVLPETRLDGVNLFPVWEGKSPKTERTLFWRTGVGGHSQKAVRSGDFKLVMDGNHTFVFDIPNDAGERHDLAQRRQDVAQKLRALLAEWERDVDAEAKAAKLPTPGRR